MLCFSVYGNQSAEALYQRTRGPYRLFKGVSLITTINMSDCRKSHASWNSPASGTSRTGRRNSAGSEQGWNTSLAASIG